jgi:hypothetical protein
MYENNPQAPQPPYGQQPQQEPYQGFYAPQQPQLGQQQGWEQQPRRGRPPGPPRRRRQRSGRRRVRNVLLGLLGVIVLIVIIANVASGGGKRPASSLTPPAAANASKSVPRSSASSSSASTSPAASAVSFTFSGSGIENSAPFNVGSGPLTVSYTYNCSSFGSSGNFIADLLYGNQSSLNSDDQPIANDLSTGGSQTTTIYPQYPGKDYYLSVNSECSWSITVTGG